MARRLSFALLSVAFVAVGICEKVRWSHRRPIESDLRLAKTRMGQVEHRDQPLLEWMIAGPAKYVDGPSDLLPPAAESSVHAEGRADQRTRTAAQILASVDARDYGAVVWDILTVAGRTDEHVVLRASFDVPTAAASDAGGKNLIRYNPQFLTTVAHEAHTDWAVVYVLAHEVAHQLAGHTRVRPSAIPTQYREMELEADELSGLVMGAFGAQLSQARRVVAAATRLSVLSVPQPLDATDRLNNASLVDRLRVVERGWRWRQADDAARPKH